MLPLSRSRDLLPPRHRRSRTTGAPGFIASELDRTCRPVQRAASSWARLSARLHASPQFRGPPVSHPARALAHKQRAHLATRPPSARCPHGVQYSMYTGTPSRSDSAAARLMASLTCSAVGSVPTSIRGAVGETEARRDSAQVTLMLIGV